MACRNSVKYDHDVTKNTKILFPRVFLRFLEKYSS
jgi:hypothetical protein